MPLIDVDPLFGSSTVHDIIVIDGFLCRVVHCCKSYHAKRDREFLYAKTEGISKPDGPTMRYGKH